MRVVDTGEEFTCIHLGDRVEFEPTLDQSRTDFTIEIQKFQADRFADAASAGELTPVEQFRAVRALFTPATVATLKNNPILSHGILRRVARIEDLIHVRLKSPSPEEEDATHTLINVSHQWLVIPGLHGAARRRTELSIPDAVLYQRQVFRALKRNSWLDWIRFGLWYLRWRPTVSRP